MRIKKYLTVQDARQAMKYGPRVREYIDHIEDNIAIQVLGQFTEYSLKIHAMNEKDIDVVFEHFYAQGFLVMKYPEENDCIMITVGWAE